MANILKCKMCGGDIEVSQDMTVGKCLYCGSTMTLPRIDSDKKARLFNRANAYRLNNEFDKAYDAYKTITEEDEQEAEAYWGMILSEYGVEYVEDPKDGKRVPTCHRTQVKNIQNTTNYEMALKYADAERKFMYQDEAELIDSIQKKIIAISSKEDAYDVFICYKETDDSTGERTQDSVIAFDLYEMLKSKGIKTFFSRVTLEDKLGQDYEPYIYAALRSAKVLLLVTTNADNAQAVWVKNEWKRFLSFMDEDHNKVIIPVYKEMSPYELPTELSKFQSQDLGKVGANQDVLRAIEKLLDKNPGSKTDDRLINELIADKVRKEEQKTKTKSFISKLIPAIMILLALPFSMLCHQILFMNGDTSLLLRDLCKRFPVYAGVFIGLAVLSAIIYIVAAILVFKNARNKYIVFLCFAGTLLYGIGVTFVSMHQFVPSLMAVLPLILSCIGAIFFAGNNIKEKKIIGVIVCCLTIVISGIIASIFSFRVIPKCSNGENIFEDQVSVSEAYADIKKSPNTNSSKIGEVYGGDYYSIIETSEDTDWYLIETNSGIKGWVSGEDITVVNDVRDQFYEYIDKGDISQACEMVEQVDERGYDEEFLSTLEHIIDDYISEGNYNSVMYMVDAISVDINKIQDDKAKEKYKTLMYKIAMLSYSKAASYEYAISKTNEYRKVLDILLSIKDSGEYEDEYNKICEEIYNDGILEYNEKKYDEAKKYFELLSKYEYKDSEEMIEKCNGETSELKECLNAFYGEWRNGDNNSYKGVKIKSYSKPTWIKWEEVTKSYASSKTETNVIIYEVIDYNLNTCEVTLIQLDQDQKEYIGQPICISIQNDNLIITDNSGEIINKYNYFN